ncbi:MAG: polyisoprenoid-binding protein [Solirubrobacterales bacterium]|nr:polyisoprenoid-binding protein [Solirubrobacterales bacterium]
MTTITSEQIRAGTYTLDPVHSTFAFAIKHNGVSTFRGQFEQVEAKLEDTVLTGTAQVEWVKIALPPLKEHLLSPDFFNAVETPTITFRSTDIRIADDGRAEVDGELTIRGVTKPVTAKGRIAYGENVFGAEVVGLALEATVDRREYGLNWQAQLPKGGDVLGWDVVLEVDLELAKA